MRLPAIFLNSLFIAAVLSSCGELESERVKNRAIRIKALEEAYASSRKIDAANEKKSKVVSASATTTPKPAPAAPSTNYQPPSASPAPGTTSPSFGGIRLRSPNITQSLPGEKDIKGGQ